MSTMDFSEYSHNDIEVEVEVYKKANIFFVLEL